MINANQVDRLRKAITGTVIVLGDSGYDAARIVWNATADKRPAVIAKCATPDDVLTAIRFAHDNNLIVAVRSGGHSISGASTCDDGIIIDLTLMNGVEVDPERKIARVNGGALLGELDRAAQAFGLVCPIGVISHTGVAGLTLGGGMGRLQRKFGLTIDSLLSVDILTADGDLLHASETTNSDLFWGMRGAGHNFGIVTSFQFKLNDLRPDVARMLLLFSPDRADEVTTFIDQFLEEATRDLFVSLAFMLSPGEAPFPEQLAGRPALAVSLMHFGSEEAAERELESFVELGGWELARARMPYLELQTMFDEANAWGKRFYMKSGFMGEVRPGFVDTCLKAIEGSPREDGADNMVGVWAWGGAIADVDEGATAFSGRTAKYWLGPETIWHHASEDSAHFSWGRSTMEALSSFLSSGNYINDIADSGESLVKAAYGEPKYRRLVDLKRTYDPKNFFSLNQNIRP